LRHTFPKYERLYGQLRIAALYKEGRKFVVWPLRVTYIPFPAAPAVSLPTGETGLTASAVLIWAPKSLHKHATERNRLRRQMREAWRLNKADLKQAYMLAINYMDKSMQPYAVIEKAVKKAIKKLNEEADS